MFANYLRLWDIFTVPKVLISEYIMSLPFPHPLGFAIFLRKVRHVFISKYVISLVSVINGFFPFYFLAIADVQDDHHFLCIHFAFIFLQKFFNSWIFADSFVSTIYMKVLVLSFFPQFILFCLTELTRMSKQDQVEVNLFFFFPETWKDIY